jgi:hypothetical protein
MNVFAATVAQSKDLALDFWHDVAIGVCSGIFSSIAASLIFLFIIGFGLRPKISISEYISAYTDKNNITSYKIKIVNQGRFFGIHDLSVGMSKIYSVDSRGSGSGRKVNVTADPVKLRINSLPNLPRKSNDNQALYAVRITIEDSDFNPQLHTEQFGNYFRVEVSCRHGLSGIKAHFTKDFHNSHDFLKPGQFEHGKSLKVVT